MSPALQPVIARLTPAEKLQLVGELWDQAASSDLELVLTTARQAKLQAEDDAMTNDASSLCWNLKTKGIASHSIRALFATNPSTKQQKFLANSGP